MSLRPLGVVEIPHKQLIAKRLAQCLNPALPSGVHQKTLEVYSNIFTSLGKDGLSADLGLYLPGLAPALSFASLSVKPNILALFESHIVQCHAAALRSALKAIIIALLPCLEEENSDEFEWTLQILESLKQGTAASAEVGKHAQNLIDAQFFWQCLFLACITSPSRRAGALAYLTRNLPRLGFNAEGENGKPQSNGNGEHAQRAAEALELAIQAVATPEPGLLIRCFCAGLQDEQQLTQRGFLDLLVTHLPLNSTVLQDKAESQDLERLVSVATSVVGRKDMSLNRRLWSWFLGPEPTLDLPTPTLKSPGSPTAVIGRELLQDMASVQIQYFERYGLEALVGSILTSLNSKTLSQAERSRPLRICLSLMDRWEIGGSIAPHIFVPCLKSIWRYQTSSAPRSDKAEVLKSASAFFDSVESTLIWSELTKLISQALRPGRSESSDMLDVVYFTVTQFNIREEEMQLVHMPLVTLFIIDQLRSKAPGKSNEETANNVIVSALKITQRLLELIPARALTDEPGVRAPVNGDRAANALGEQGVSKHVLRFYAQSQASSDLQSPFAGMELGSMVLQEALGLALESLNSKAPSSTTCEAAVSQFAAVVRKSTGSSPNQEELFALYGVENENFQLGRPGSTSQFPVTIARLAVLEAILTAKNTAQWLSAKSIRDIVPTLVSELWPALSPSTPAYNVEAVQCMWRLQVVCPDPDLVESTLVNLMGISESDAMEPAVTHESFRRFTLLWSHSPPVSHKYQQQGGMSHGGASAYRAAAPGSSKLPVLEQPLFMLLDLLEDESSLLRPFIVSWVQSMTSLPLVLDLIVARILDLDLVRSLCLYARRGRETRQPAAPEISDGPEMYLYYVSSFQHVMLNSPTTIWAALAASTSVEGDDQDSQQSLQELLTDLSLKILRYRHHLFDASSKIGLQVNRTSLSLLKHFLMGPLSKSIIEIVEEPLIEELGRSIERAEASLQSPLMETILAALQVRKTQNSVARSPSTPAPPTAETPRTSKHLTVATDVFDRRAPSPKALQPPSDLLTVIRSGISSPNSRQVLDHWISFVNQCLPYYESGIFRNLIPLVECFCTTLGSVFETLQNSFDAPHVERSDVSEPVIGLLLNGLEQSLATAHDALSIEEPSTAPIKSPEQQQTGFFGNMVSGVFTADNRSKTMTANNRLTVILCFKDAMRLCYSIWSWGDTRRNEKSRDPAVLASYNHVVLRLRNRARRIFEHLFAAEALECLETLIDLWQGHASNEDPSQSTMVLNLLNVIESSRPKITIPAIFNAIYSRTNPSALEPSRKSTLTSNLSDTSLAYFLVTYLRSLEDDTMDEIWSDCLAFLKDVLGNPMPHRQTLPRLLEFTAVLGEKVDRTTFGEQRKMRRELGDLFVRLLAAALTTRPMAFPQETARPGTPDHPKGRPSLEYRAPGNASGLVAVLATIVPNISKVLVDADRITATANTISSSVLAPVFRSKAFPENVDEDALDLLTGLLRTPEASKAAKKDVGEAFNDSKFFSTALPLAEKRWLPILRSWALADKERMPELLARLTPPTAAGIVLGLGATSARLEADRRTQLNLRRIATLILAADHDTFVVNLASLQPKLVELMGATATSSPSAVTRAEVYLIVRALVLRTSAVHLTALWPTLHAELVDALTAAYPTDTADAAPNVTCLLQACKLLDALLTLHPDDFQLQAWLFVSDTPDAVYRPAHAAPVALVDDLAAALDAQAPAHHHHTSGLPPADASAGRRRPLLAASSARDTPKEEVMEKTIRPFLRQLSIYAFESTYSLQPPDWDACFDDLLRDLFDDSTLV